MSCSLEKKPKKVNHYHPYCPRPFMTYYYTKNGFTFLSLQYQAILLFKSATVCGVGGRTLSVGFHPFGFGWMNPRSWREAPKWVASSLAWHSCQVKPCEWVWHAKEVWHLGWIYIEKWNQNTDTTMTPTFRV